MKNLIREFQIVLAVFISCPLICFSVLLFQIPAGALLGIPMITLGFIISRYGNHLENQRPPNWGYSAKRQKKQIEAHLKLRAAIKAAMKSGELDFSIPGSERQFWDRYHSSENNR